MKCFKTIAATAILLLGGILTAHAEVKKIQMKIGGYLCGN